MRLPVLTYALLALCALACRSSTVVVGTLGATAGNGAADGRVVRDAGLPSTVSDAATDDAWPAGSARPTDASYQVSVERGSLQAFCARTGSPLVGLRAAGGADCAWRAERQLFAYALCTCQSLQLSADSFVLDSFDSRQGAPRAGQTGAALGVNGALGLLANDTQILGSLTLGDSAPLQLSDRKLVVALDLETSAAITASAGELRVGRDLWLAGELQTQATAVRVDRDAHLAQASAALEPASVGGRIYMAPGYRATPPCRCESEALLDVAALTAAVQAQNDDAAVGFSPDGLRFPMFSTELSGPLPCGRLFASGVTLPTLSTQRLRADGRTALFVQGDVSVDTLSTLILEPGSTGELDLFVAGDLTVAAGSTLTLGEGTRPAATRIYVSGQVRALGTLALAGNLYAPNADIELGAVTADVDLYGAIFARNLRVSRRHMHFDRAILQAGPECEAPPPQGCDGAAQCPAELTCLDGRCAACSADTDCFEPLRCMDGKCQLLVSDWP